MKLITVYIVMGLVWCILGLPNLLSKSNNNALKATGLALLRVITWPVLAVMSLRNLVIKVKEEPTEDE
jgi:hypothetical protein